MTRAELHAAAMALPGATLDIKWGDDHCYCVDGKMFCVTDGAYSNLSFKASDIAFEALTSNGRATPARYLARAMWVSLPDLANEDPDEVAGWVVAAHALVVAKLSRKRRRELGIG